MEHKIHKQWWFWVLILLVILLIINNKATNEKEIETLNLISPQDETEGTINLQDEVKPIEAEVKHFQILKTSTNERYDKAQVLYVLVDPIDLSDDSFKPKIEGVIKDIVSENGKKISIKIFDDINTLNLAYSQYGDLSLGRVRTEEENLMLERHLIAMFDGQLETGLYANELAFFPGAFTSNAIVGMYVDSTEFNP